MFDFDSIEESLQFLSNNDDDNNNNNSGDSSNASTSSTKRVISKEAAAKRAAFEAAKLRKTKVSKHDVKVRRNLIRFVSFRRFV